MHGGLPGPGGPEYRITASLPRPPRRGSSQNGKGGVRYGENHPLPAPADAPDYPAVLAAAHGHCGHGGGWYLLSGLGRQTRQSIAEQFQLNLQLGADRVESAVEASRPPSYDPELRDAWNQYRRDQEYAPLYRRCSALFSRLYQSDSRFRYAVFGFSRTPEELSIVVPGSSAGLLSNQVRDQWREDLPAVLGLAEGLDSSVGFLRQGGELYLVRNLMDSNYQAIGVLALALDPDREAALVYLCFGWYPLLRPRLARLPSRLARAAVRIALCTAVCLLLYGVVWRVLGLPRETAAGGFQILLLAMANATFLILDRALERLTLLWRRRLRRRFFRQ